MEFDSVNIVHDPQIDTTNEPVKEAEVLVGDGKCYSFTDTVPGKKADTGEEEGKVGLGSGDVNMEASISADDVMRAGGFGARDDISNFLPVASDSTDFEASLRDARDYEEPQKEICRPGLGWKDVEE